MFGLMRRKTHLAVVRELQATIAQEKENADGWKGVAIAERNKGETLRKLLKEVTRDDEEAEQCLARSM